MALKKLPGKSPSRRHATGVEFGKIITKKKPEKRLLGAFRKSGGRGMYGRVTSRHRGGGHKRRYRKVDFRRDKRDVPARVAAIEYDPNRSAHLALLHYLDGEKAYILSPDGLKRGDQVIASDKAQIKPGNAMPLKNIPLGTAVHNIELVPGHGGKIARSAGSRVIISAREGKYIHLKMPSSEIRRVLGSCLATIGQVGNEDWRHLTWGKAGRKRWLGIRPTVRGTAQDPKSHPHGGGEGRSGIGMPSPKSPWGKKTLGKKTRKKKPSDKYIVKKRKK